MKAAAALALLLALAAGGAQARDADPVAVGRYHLRKANQLAGEDHCHSAIHEYTLAYQKLNDPVVLFNRGECYRRIGQAAKAVSDYRAFLEAVPSAPNRAEIETRIAALIPPPSEPARPLAATPPARPPQRVEPAPAHPVAAAAPPPLSPPPPPSLEPPPPPVTDSPPAILAQPVATPEPETQIHQDQPARNGHAWVWIALGAAVAGGAVGAYFALRPPATTPPVTDLGNYKF